MPGEGRQDSGAEGSAPRRLERREEQPTRGERMSVAVFAGFAMGDYVGFQQMGFGDGVALLLDATVIRSVILPSAMALLGEQTWYLPGWLEWLPWLQMEGRRS